MQKRSAMPQKEAETFLRLANLFDGTLFRGEKRRIGAVEEAGHCNRKRRDLPGSQKWKRTLGKRSVNLDARFAGFPVAEEETLDLRGEVGRTQCASVFLVTATASLAITGVREPNVGRVGSGYHGIFELLNSWQAIAVTSEL
jgi:hypothetical protein